jgi:hypothetical protein
VRKQDVEHLSDRPALAAADVVDLARLALVERKPVRADHVADVGPVALARQVTVVDHWLVLSCLDQRDLARHGAGHEVRATARAGVIETSCDDQMHAVRLEVLVRELVLRHLADRVGRKRP